MGQSFSTRRREDAEKNAERKQEKESQNLRAQRKRRIVKTEGRK
jgi:hypothetical protein